MASTLDIVIRATNQASGVLRDLQGDLDKLDKKSGVLGKGFAGLQQGIKAAGTAAVVGVGAATAAVGGLAVAGVNEFAKFEKSMNEVFTLLPGISDQAMGDMSQQVKDFAVEFGVLPDEVVPALYQSLSAGVPQNNVFEFLEVAQKAAVGGVTDLETAVDGISSVVNAYGADVMDAAKASDIMFTAVKLGKTDFTQLSGALFNVIPVASALGVNFEDVGAGLAAITAQGVPTSVATTQMRQMFVELSKDGGETAKLFERIAGESFRDFIASGKDTQQALALLETHAKETGVGVNDLFGSVEAGNAALALTGKGTEAFVNALDEMETAGGATNAAFDRMMTGLSPVIDRFKALGKVLLIDIGEAVTPALEPIIDWLERTLPGAVRTAIDWFGRIGSAAKTLFDGIQNGELWTVFDDGSSVLESVFKKLGMSEDAARKLATQIITLKTNVQNAIKPIADFVTKWVSWKDVLIALGIVVMSVVVPALAGIVTAAAPIVLTFAGLVAAVSILRNAWETNFLNIQGITKTVFEDLVAVWDGLKTGLSTGNWQPLFDALGQLWTDIKAWITFVKLTIGFRVREWAEAFTEWASGIWEKLSPKLLELWTSFTGWVKEKALALPLLVDEWATAFTEWAKGIWSGSGEGGGLSTTLSTMWTDFTGWISEKTAALPLLVDAWLVAFTEWAKNIWSGSGEGGGLSTTLATMWTNFSGWITEKALALPLLVDGWLVAFTGWAKNIWSGSGEGGGLSTTLETMWTDLKGWIDEKAPTLGTAIDTWTEKFSSLYTKLEEAWNTLKPIVDGHITAIKEGFSGLVADIPLVTAAFQNLWTQVGPALTALGTVAGIVFAGIATVILYLVENVLPVAGELLATAIDGMAATIKLITDVVNEMITAVQAAIDGDWAQVWESAKTILNLYKDFVYEHMARIWRIFEIAWGVIKQTVIDILNAMGLDGETIMATFQTNVEGIWNNLKSSADIIFGAIKNAIEWLVTAKDNAVTAFEDFKTFMSGLVFNTGAFDAIKRVIDGVKLAAIAAAGAIANMLNMNNGLNSPTVNPLLATPNTPLTSGNIYTGGTRRASGTIFSSGGLTTINERGPELLIMPGRNRQVMLPRGTQIVSGEQTAAMVGAGGGVVVNLYPQIASDIDAESLAWRVARIIQRNGRR